MPIESTKEWTENHGSENTIKAYRNKLRQFAKFQGAEFIDPTPLGTEERKEAKKKNRKKLYEFIDDYIEGKNTWKDWYDDFKDFYKHLSGNKADASVLNYLTIVKNFLDEMIDRLPQTEWKQFKRGLNETNEPMGFDEKGTKEQWKNILSEMKLKYRALFITMLSTGMRIGEATRIEKNDLQMNKDPARIYLRPEITKGGRRRIVFLTEEAEEILKKWLNWSEGKTDAKGREYDEMDRVFPVKPQVARDQLHEALEKCGYDEKIEATGWYKIRTHSCRKFFRSNAELKEVTTKSILGHKKGSLDFNYIRQKEEELAMEFKQNEESLQVLETGKTGEGRLRETEIETLRLSMRASGISEDKIDEVLDDWAKTEKVLGQAKAEKEVKGILKNRPFDQVDLAEVSVEAFEDLKERLLSLAGKPRQKVINEDELEKHLADGWRYVDQNNGGKVIVEK